METTCWTMIDAAARGNPSDREAFVHRYTPAIRAYLARRWQAVPCRQELDDTVHEIFLQCFREGGALERVRRDAPGGFRAFLFGIARHVAQHAEAKVIRHRPGSELDLEAVDDDETSLSQAFDRAWAQQLLREAAELQSQRAERKGPAARRRVELLRLRFVEDLPIRDIAARWGMTAEALYQDQFRARREFKEALLEVVSFHCPGTPEEIERECVRLQELLS